MSGDLQHALAAVNYQMRISQIMRWNILFMGGLMSLTNWEGGQSLWFILGVAFLFLLVFYASGWEMRIYKAKKRELEVLQKKLQEDVTS
jgi:hypothetical protein